MILEKMCEGYHLILFQETKLKSSTDFKLEGWDIKTLGDTGLALAYPIDGAFTVDLLNSDSFCTINRHVQLATITDPRFTDPVTIANLYVKGGLSSTAADWDFLQDLSYAHKDLLVVGDYNAKHTEWDISGCNPNGKGLHLALPDLELYLLNNGEPTRMAERAGDSDSCIDLALACAAIMERSTWVRGPDMGSDHWMCEVRIKPTLAKTAGHPREPPYRGTPSNGIWGTIRRFAKTRCEHSISTKRSHAPSWWTKEVDTAWTKKKEMDKAFERARQSGSPDAFINSRIARNRASAEFKKCASAASSAQWDEICAKANLTATDFWRFCNRLDKRKSCPKGIMYSEDGDLLRTDEEQGRAFLQRFRQQSDHDDVQERDHLIQQLDSLALDAEPDQALTVSEIQEALRTSKSGAPGPDKITVSNLKEMPAHMFEDLCRAYNKSWRSGSIPAVWTDAFLCPVPKPGKDHRLLRGSRIIVVQNCIGKLPEKVIARRIAKHIEPMLPQGMGGYRSGRDTWVNAAALAADVWEGFTKKENTLIVALDLEDAYNKVRLPILADRMLRLGLSVQCVRWTIKALSMRRCMMKNGTWCSDWVEIRTGLPQGSPLSPVLFNIYTMDLARLSCKQTPLRTFADDVITYTRGRQRQSIIEKIEPQLVKVDEWCGQTGSDVNPEKVLALYCTLNNRLPAAEVPCPEYQGRTITPEDSMRHLGVFFDRQLNFTCHVDKIVERVRGGCNAIKAAVGRGAEERHLLMLYEALVLSVISFALPIVSLSNNQLGRLERVQNTCLRVITGCTRSTPVSVLQFMTGIVSVTAKQELDQATLLARALQNEEHALHSYCSSFWKGLYETSGRYNLRRRSHNQVTTDSMLSRKSWLEHAHQACVSLIGNNTLATSPAWTQLKDYDEPPYEVVVRLSRACRDWPEGAANAICCSLFEDYGTDDRIIVATDGSFSEDTQRAGWGLAVFQFGRCIGEEAGMHQVYVSSTRMELEAIRRGLHWLSVHQPPTSAVIFATDSMAVLSRLSNFEVPDNWWSAAEYLHGKRTVWMYVPGHAGVSVNVKADALAAAASVPSPLDLYHTDIRLLGHFYNKSAVTSEAACYSEGTRITELGGTFGLCRKSRYKGPSRTRKNHLLTGNIGTVTLNEVLRTLSCGIADLREAASVKTPISH